MGKEKEKEKTKKIKLLIEIDATLEEDSENYIISFPDLMKVKKIEVKEW